jgi:hypothetical protein
MGGKGNYPFSLNNIFLLFYFISLSLSLSLSLYLSPVTPPRRWVHQNSTPNQLPAKTLSGHSSSPVGSLEFHTQLTSGQNNNKHQLSA